MTAVRRHPRRSRRPRHVRRHGVALILVLWLVVILGVVGAGVMRATREATQLAANTRARVVARYAAESGLEATIARIDGALRTLGDSAARRAFLNALEPGSRNADSMLVGDGRVVVAIVDASARLDVNAAPAEKLARLFAWFTDPVRARAMADAVRRRVEGEGRTSSPVGTLEALRELPGTDERVLQLAAPYLTVDGDGTVNRAAASDTVLRAAFGELREAPSRLVLVARGWMRGHPLTHEIQGVYAIASDRLVLVRWRERTL
jgi:general secretion pathway protein K